MSIELHAIPKTKSHLYYHFCYFCPCSSLTWSPFPFILIALIWLMLAVSQNSINVLDPVRPSSLATESSTLTPRTLCRPVLTPLSPNCLITSLCPSPHPPTWCQHLKKDCPFVYYYSTAPSMRQELNKKLLTELINKSHIVWHFGEN